MVDACTNLVPGLELFLGTDSAGEISGGPVFRGIVFGRQGFALLGRAETGPVPSVAEETAGHNCLVHRSENRDDSDL